MADVITKAISANSVKNGAATVGVNKQGEDYSLARGSDTISLAQTELDLTNRFDDPRYYAGDAAT